MFSAHGPVLCVGILYIYLSYVCVLVPLMKVCSLLTWHLEQVTFWNKMFSETETCVISQGQGGGGDLWGAETDTILTHVANAHEGLEIKNNHKHL